MVRKRISTRLNRKIKGFTKRMAAGLTSFALALTLLPSALEAVKQQEINAAAEEAMVGGFATNVLTGNWAAIGFGTLERGIMWGLNTTSKYVRNDDAQTALKIAKNLFGGKQSITLANITNMCKDILVDLEEMRKDMDLNFSYIENQINTLIKMEANDEYTTAYNKLYTDFYVNRYGALYDDLIDLQTAMADDNPNINTITSAYNVLVNDFTPDPEKGYDGKTTNSDINFVTDLNDFLAVISPYPSGQPITEGVSPADSDYWGQNTGTTTYLDALYNKLSTVYPFEHQYYESFAGACNQIATYGYAYLEVYRNYVLYMIDDVEASTLTEQEKNAKIDSYWDQYEECSYKLYRGLNQMFSLYPLNTWMKSYDYDVTVDMSYQSSRSVPSSYSYDSLSDNGPLQYETVDATVTSSTMDVYQVKPIGGSRSYIFGKTTGGNGNIKAIDLQLKSPEHGCHILSADYYNLQKTSSPGGYTMMKDGSELEDILSTSAYLTDSEGAKGNFITFLRNNKLTDITITKQNSDGSNSVSTIHKTIKDEGYWVFLDSRRYAQDNLLGNQDGDVNVLGITHTIKSGATSNVNTEIDVYDDIAEQDGKGEEGQTPIMIILSGNPNPTLRTSVSSGGSVVMQKRNSSGTTEDISLTKNGNFYSGETLIIKVKPDEGKTIDSITLTNGKTYGDAKEGEIFDDFIGNLDADNSWEEVMSAEELISSLEVDDEGYYTFEVTAPYRDCVVNVDFTDESDTHTAYLEGNSYGSDFDASASGVITFSPSNGSTSAFYAAESTVEVCVRSFEGYACDGISVTDANGSLLDLEITKGSEIYSPTTTNTSYYRFSMPSKDVFISANYVSAHTVTIKNNESYGNLQFEDDCENEGWLSTSKSYAEGDTVTIWEQDIANGYYVSNASIVYYTPSYEEVEIEAKAISKTVDGTYVFGIEFEMPDYDVIVTPEYSRIPSSGLVTIVTDENGTAKFVSSDILNTSQRVYSEGDSVEISVLADEGYIIDSVSAVNTNGSSKTDLELTQDGDIYSFIMPKGTVMVSVSFKLKESVEIVVSYPQSWQPDIAFEGDEFAKQETYEKYFEKGEAVTFYHHSYSLHAPLLTIYYKASGTDEYTLIDPSEIGFENINNCRFSFLMPDGSVRIDFDNASNDSNVDVWLNNPTNGKVEFESETYDSQNLYSLYSSGSLNVKNCKTIHFCLSQEVSVIATPDDGYAVEDVVFTDINTGKDFDWDYTLDDNVIKFLTTDVKTANCQWLVTVNFAEEETVLPKDEDGRFKISCYEDLVIMRDAIDEDYERYGSADYVLTSNIINSDSEIWTKGIGSIDEDKPFNGSLDGDGYFLIGLMPDNESYSALFEEIGEQGVVEQLFIFDTKTQSDAAQAAGIAIINNGTIDHCVSGENITPTNVPDPLNQTKRVNSTTLNSTITGTQSGGIAAINNGRIIGSRNVATVQTPSSDKDSGATGGIAAVNNGEIYACANLGTIGRNHRTAISGGIAGQNNGSISACYSNGIIYASKTLGSVVGENDGDVTDTFYTLLNDAEKPVGDGAELGEGCELKDSDYMKTADFTDELSDVTDDEQITWITNDTFNNGYPSIRCEVFKQLSIVTEGITISGVMHRSLSISYTLSTVADSNQVMSVYTADVTDNSSNAFISSLWIEGDLTYTMAKPDSTAKLYSLDENGDIDEPVEYTTNDDGTVSFRMQPETDFAWVTTASGAQNSDPSPSTSGAVKSTAAVGAIALSAAAVMTRKRKED
ncbi:MAG: hypothetical protein LUI06_07285 [Ruminococcus sp.]|nr:hypothetical protein [Ruminococcus sp.]